MLDGESAAPGGRALPALSLSHLLSSNAVSEVMRTERKKAAKGCRALPALILPVCMTSEICPRTASARGKDRAKPGGRAPRCDFLFSIRRILPI